jgi:hypothetical protein
MRSGDFLIPTAYTVTLTVLGRLCVPRADKAEIVYIAQ